MSGSNSIVGVWLLYSFHAELEDGTRLLPYGQTPGGRIVYTTDGFMSAHLWHPEFHVKGMPAGREPSYFSYCGDWSIYGDTVRHRVHAATEPSWTGKHRLRTMVFRDDRLELTAEKVVFDGKSGRGVLVWGRWT